MLKVARIGYTMKNGSTRKASIIGTSEKDAVQFLRRITNDNISSIDDLGMDTEVHGYTDAAVDYLQKKLGKLASNNTPQQTEITKNYICPWCEREFDKPTGLKVHIQRTHQKKEEKKEETSIDTEL